MNQAEVDHVTPKSKGGSNSNSNAQVISKEENLKKGNRKKLKNHMSTEKKFTEDLQIYIFTTRFVIEVNSEITFISHDEDGDWQFMSADEFEEEDARVISLGEMIEYDSSIMEMADLPLGYEAERSKKFSKWIVSKSG